MQFQILVYGLTITVLNFVVVAVVIFVTVNSVTKP